MEMSVAHVPPRRIIVIGGGESGVLTAQRLLQAGTKDLLVTLIERSTERIGALREHAGALAPFQTLRAARPGRLNFLNAEARSATLTQQGVVIDLSDGTSCGGHIAVLATGRDPTMSEDDVFTIPCDAETRIPRVASVVGIGTNFAVMSSFARLLARGHTGRLYAVSSHGRVPLLDADSMPMTLDRADVPFGTGLIYLTRWLRRSVAWAAERGIDWRSVVDAFQPHAEEVWHHLPAAERQRFLRHLSGFWDAHRDRMRNDLAEVIRRARATGQLAIVRGSVRAVTPLAQGAKVEIDARSRSATVVLHIDKVLQRKGPHQERLGMRNPVVASVIAQGLARPDPVALGLEVTDGGALVDRNGVLSRRLYAVGPASRAAIWEIMGTLPVHEQVEAVVERLTSTSAEGARTAAANERTRHR